MVLASISFVSAVKPMPDAVSSHQGRWPVRGALRSTDVTPAMRLRFWSSQLIADMISHLCTTRFCAIACFAMSYNRLLTHARFGRAPLLQSCNCAATCSSSSCGNVRSLDDDVCCFATSTSIFGAVAFREAGACSRLSACDGCGARSGCRVVRSGMFRGRGGGLTVGRCEKSR